ncbi:unnamed protein product [Protopolystoma xenopodis]|uniref:Uncharacterized protein n=1 Tax=Protopolystoma xenopodis TaxID=117903 RepID=A0A3S5BP87_9PLAT|nr:unnamed protein product [Protopolystoma xenopodis]
MKRSIKSAQSSTLGRSAGTKVTAGGYVNTKSARNDGASSCTSSSLTLCRSLSTERQRNIQTSDIGMPVKKSITEQLRKSSACDSISRVSIFITIYVSSILTRRKIGLYIFIKIFYDSFIMLKLLVSLFTLVLCRYIKNFISLVLFQIILPFCFTPQKLRINLINRL